MSQVQRTGPRTSSIGPQIRASPRQATSAPSSTAQHGAAASSDGHGAAPRTIPGPRPSLGGMSDRARRPSTSTSAAYRTTARQVEDVNMQSNGSPRKARVSTAGNVAAGKGGALSQPPSATSASRRRSLVPTSTSTTQKSTPSSSSPVKTMCPPQTPPRPSTTIRRPRMSECSTASTTTLMRPATSSTRVAHTSIASDAQRALPRPTKVLPASSPFRENPDKAQNMLLQENVKTLTTENEALASQLADARLAQSDAEARVEQSRIEAARSRVEADAALQQVQALKQRQTGTISSPKALRSKGSAKKAVTDTGIIVVREDSDDEGNVSLSIDALRKAAGSGQGLTQDAARALEQEFAGQERILKALQRDNELKTRQVAALQRQKAKLEAFCGRFYGEADWHEAVYGSKSAKDDPDASQIDDIALSTMVISAGLKDDGTQINEPLSEEVATDERALRPKDLNNEQQGTMAYPICSSPIKQVKRARSSIDGQSFVSASHAVDASSFCTAAGNTTCKSPSKEDHPSLSKARTRVSKHILVEQDVIDAVIKSQSSLLQAIDRSRQQGP